jgi:acetoin utilization deacetylase AcuC-like enzyme
MMKVFYSENHKDHAPDFEVFEGGVRTPYLETPDRAARILNALKETDWAEVHAPLDFGMEPILAVHDRDYVDFLKHAWAQWIAEEPGVDPSSGRSPLLPATFALRSMQRRPEGLLGQAGYYMMDLSAPIVAGTYAAALQAVNCALSAASSIAADGQAAFALTRPPGHHAGRSNCGGYCYFNNAAIAADWLSRKGKAALLDIDYHAGNGTQEIFYERGDVLSISIHADPAYEYPYFAGYEEQQGSGAGQGWHRNFPLPAGTDDSQYLQALEQALVLLRDFKPLHMVVSAGMDIYAKDPLGRIKVTTKGIVEIGRQIAALQRPTAIIMEGGYNNQALGLNTVSFLEAFR